MELGLQLDFLRGNLTILGEILIILREEGQYLWVGLKEGMEKLKDMDLILDSHLQVDQGEGDSAYRPLPSRSAKVQEWQLWPAHFSRKEGLPFYSSSLS